MNEPFDWKAFQQTMKQLPGVTSQGKTPAFDLSWVEKYVRDTIDETNRTVSKAAKSYSDSAKQKQQQAKKNDHTASTTEEPTGQAQAAESDDASDEQSVKPKGNRLAVRFFANSTLVLARIELPQRLNPHRVRLHVQAYSLRISILPEQKGRQYTLPAPIDPDTAQAEYHHQSIEFSAQRLDTADWGRPVPVRFPEEDP